MSFVKVSYCSSLVEFQPKVSSLNFWKGFIKYLLSLITYHLEDTSGAKKVFHLTWPIMFGFSDDICG
jgi:hypothetical protein